LYVINHSPKKDKFEIDTPLSFTKAEDILSNKVFDIEKGKLPITLEGRSVLVLHLAQKTEEIPRID